VSLTPEEVRNMNEAFPPGVAAGERYPAAQMQRIDR
jgi:hypothetical protein